MKQIYYLPILSASFLLFVLSCKKDPIDVYSSGNWVFNSNGIPGANRSEAVCFVVGNNAYITTGYNSNLVKDLADLYAFNPTVGGSLGSWTQLSDPPANFSPRRYAVAFAIGTNGYITLGQDINSNYLKDTWQYNTLTDTWTQKADFGSGDKKGTGRRDATAFAIGNYGYVLCGADETGSNKKDSWVYDPSTDNWSLTPVQFDGGKRNGALALVHGDSAFIVTGVDGDVEADDMIKFVPANKSNPWTVLKKIRQYSLESYDDDYSDIQRDHAVGFVVGDSAYISLGTIINNGNTVKTWGYDMKKDLWFRKTSFEIRGVSAGLTGALGFTVAGRAYVCTGASSSLSKGDLIEWLPSEPYNSKD